MESLLLSVFVLLLLPFHVSVCTSDQCHVQIRDILYVSRQDVCPAVDLENSPPPPRAAADEGTSTDSSSLVEYVFLIELSSVTKTTYLNYLTSRIKILSSILEKGSSPQFTILVYSIEQTPPILVYFRKFQSFPEIYDLKEEILRTGYSSQSNVVLLSSEELRYALVDAALEILLSVLNQDTMFDLNGSAHSLSPRPSARLHIVTVLGLFDENSKDQPSTTPIYSGVTDISERKRSIEKNIDLILRNSNSNPAFYFFVPRGVAPVVEFIGSPRHEIHYKDCSHLNKALTLQALLRDDVSTGSLQAHLLASGRNINILDLAALKRKECIHAIGTGSMSWPLSSRIDECTIGRDRVCKASGGYCSPLHGCVMDTSTSPETHNDRIPLTGSLVMSHADLVIKQATPTHPSTRSLIEKVSIVEPPNPTAPVFSLDKVIGGRPHTWRISTDDTEFAERLIKKGKPVVVKNSVVSSWPAMEKWNFTYLANHMGTDTLTRVKCTNRQLTFDPDQTAPLKLSISLPFTESNMSTSSFFSCVQDSSTCSDNYTGHYYFGSVPESLKSDINPTRVLYRTKRDYKAGRQFMWVSSAGMITHGHFDQDYNFFVQIRGEKRFTLWPPYQHELLYMYPRVHPLWHKSRVNFRDPDLTRFPQFAKSRALQVVLGPGDVLHVPPYTWHYVETLSPSISLSTWSHDYDLYSHMNAIYRHDHKFDLIKDPRGQMFALRLYMDMMIHDLYGYNQTTSFFSHLLSTRFTGLYHLFPPSPSHPHICSASLPNKIPTCLHIHGYVKLDMAVIGSHFKALQPEVMDVLFGDYVEEITAQVVGVGRMVAFFRYCFLGQEYYVTELGDEEHALWDHKDSTEDDDSNL